jgi:DNA-binding transcriptional MerR regulator
MNEILYSSRHVQVLYGVTAETVRNWSEVFSSHLSIHANPGKGRKRSFTVEDMQVIDLIANEKKRGVTFDEILMALIAGSRGDTPPALETVDAMIGEDTESTLTVQVADLQTKLALATRQLEALATVHEENIRLKAETAATERRRIEDAENYQAQIDRLHAEIGRLNREMGRLEALSREDGIEKD